MLKKFMKTISLYLLITISLRTFFRISYLMAILSGGLSIAVAAYLIVWCSYIQGISSDDWETTHPYMIPIATGCGLLSGVW